MSYRIVFSVPWLSKDSKSVEGKKALDCAMRCAKLVGSCTVRPGLVLFDVDAAFSPQSSAVVNAQALNALMECLTELDVIWRIYNPNAPFLYNSGVYYQTPIEIWDTIPAIYARGHADCKGFAAARAAELRIAGYAVRPVFRFLRIPSGNVLQTDRGILFHILDMIATADGQIHHEDPSKKLGMVPPQETQIEQMQ